MFQDNSKIQGKFEDRLRPELEGSFLNYFEEMKWKSKRVYVDLQNTCVNYANEIKDKKANSGNERLAQLNAKIDNFRKEQNKYNELVAAYNNLIKSGANQGEISKKLDAVNKQKEVYDSLNFEAINKEIEQHKTNEDLVNSQIKIFVENANKLIEKGAKLTEDLLKKYSRNILEANQVDLISEFKAALAVSNDNQLLSQLANKITEEAHEIFNFVQSNEFMSYVTELIGLLNFEITFLAKEMQKESKNDANSQQKAKPDKNKSQNEKEKAKPDQNVPPNKKK